MSPDPCDSVRSYGKYRATACGIDSPKSCSSSIPVRTALRRLGNDEKHAVDMKDIIIAMLSFSIFVAAMFLHIPTTNMYYQSHAMSSTSGRASSTYETSMQFIKIETISDVFDWLNSTFVPQVFVTEDYNRKTLPEDERGRVGSLNKVLGARMEPPKQCFLKYYLYVRRQHSEIN
ncbi:hypothetical protein PF005_g26920 [Phytophthora fragariae]|uniref:Polycystin domain-containing protein n=2 Tax=Phytophthora fragariae TaxID=53985 RepID=A0A6A3WBH8_9STRA|nr:hypothetical protein PF009_g27570 [Phytophthora fragariae]KAE9084841.1 hypothetical protein PF006_g26389 [Phytophthora fragariae]KAE9171976.1 hypothetical protein PF005_g26920 [Phytophthora fragariae]KAE9176799.1 hypothetical protein PF002_g28506 [Phytophthora fragariae]KAE9273836.1 hypothetical protein PF001_g27328 [Phytophthora fragariae]